MTQNDKCGEKNCEPKKKIPASLRIFSYVIADSLIVFISRMTFLRSTMGILPTYHAKIEENMEKNFIK